jgi:hypothetical protein
MNQEKITQLVGMIQALDGKIDAFKDEVGSRFNDLEQRMTSLEGAVAGAARPVLLGAPPRAASPVVRNSGYGTNPLPRRECYRAPQPALETSVHRAAPSAKAIGSTSNATFLPFAIERIAKKHQQKFADDKRHWLVLVAPLMLPLLTLFLSSFCGTETFSLSCFRLDHFRWCRVHQRPVLPPHNNCGRDYQGCEQVKWGTSMALDEVRRSNTD